MNKKSLILISLLSLCAFAGGYSLQQIFTYQNAYTQNSKQQEALHPAVNKSVIGNYRPDFTLPDLNNHLRRLDEWNGRPLLINFWATWCAPCRREIPALIKTQQQYQNQNLMVIGIAFDRQEMVHEFLQDFSINYPVLYGEQTIASLISDYGNRAGTLPYSVFVDAEGIIRYIHGKGELTFDEISTLLQEKLILNEPN